MPRLLSCKACLNHSYFIRKSLAPADKKFCRSCPFQITLWPCRTKLQLKFKLGRTRTYFKHECSCGLIHRKAESDANVNLPTIVVLLTDSSKLFSVRRFGRINLQVGTDSQLNAQNFHKRSEPTIQNYEKATEGLFCNFSQECWLKKKAFFFWRGNNHVPVRSRDHQVLCDLRLRGAESRTIGSL